MPKFYSLIVREIHRETPKAVSILFTVPKDAKEVFSFKAGQYVTLRKTIGGEEVRRSYSLCTPPKSEALKVAVKEVTDGTLSRYLNTQLREGDILEVMPPEGRFVFEPNEAPQNILAVAAGSGITPVMSIILTALEEQSSGEVVLVYGNKSPEDTIFQKELLVLQEQYPDRFYVYWTYSQHNEEGAFFGRVERSTVNLVLKNKHKSTTFDAFYLCGPEEMIQVVSDTLCDNGVSKECIFFELFTSSTPGQGPQETLANGMTKVYITLDEEQHTLTMGPKTSVLEAALKEGLDAPYSCQGGICSSCIARLVDGEVVMDKNQILTDGEIGQGFILTCQSHPTTAEITVDYDDV